MATEIAEIDEINKKYTLKADVPESMKNIRSKYKNAFDVEEEEDSEKIRIDTKNSDMYGYKKYNLDKYDSRHW